MGIAPATSTFTQLFDGEAYMNIKFRQLLNHSAIKKHRPQIIVGGPGAWQLEDRKTRSNLGVNCVLVGEGEKVAGSLFEIENPAIRFAALKKTEDRNTFVVRVYNPTAETQKCNLKFHTPVSRAWQTNLNEKREQELKVTKSNQVQIAAPSNKIVTVEIKA